jgi:peptidylprolyl isomerase
MLRVFSTCLTFALVAALAGSPAAAEDKLFLTLKTGTVVIKLRPDLAPKHVERFTTLAKQGFYDGLKWHRVIDGFIAQTGDPTGIGFTSSSLPNLEPEFSKEPFRRGTVAATLRGEVSNTANSQFFICFDDKACSQLGGHYTIWGEVADGMELIDQLKRSASTMVNGKYVPTADADIVVKARVGPSAEVANAAPIINPDDDKMCNAAAQSNETTDVNIEACTRVIETAQTRGLSGAELAKTYAHRGQHQRGRGRLDDALADYQSARKQSDDDYFQFLIGEVYLDKKDYQKAIDSFSAAKRSSDQWLLERARALEGLGRKEEAIAEYKKYESKFGTGILAASARATVNEALIRLGDRKAPDPAPPPAAIVAKPSAVPWKRECTERRQNLDNTEVKAATAAASSDQAGVCALIETVKTQSWLYCSCAADDEGPSKLAGCLKELSMRAEEWNAKFSCPSAPR